ncbi:lactose permease [Bifidobacterium breve]|uniref:lactose permease n=1 Tax=Bifidobacterium breve TaxID=1685 RepID=UPI001B3C9767|nr:lactose permease [Bifidobacterium breve]MDB1188615.1 lactose permease [Bifidobacterium breve]
MPSSTAEPQKKLNKGRLAAFAFGNFGQALSYNALSTYFMVFATNALFAGVDKTTAADMTQANITTFEGFAFWMPLAFIIGFLIFAFFVKIDEKAHARIVAKIEANLHDESDAAKYGEDIAKAAPLGKESAAR